ncbi:uncharacterized protein LOC119328461 [Triticum dicoccoides]|uniref:uncharacterized protein LOC119328461 n=1 Tax=Triticum dicoccoides TaxID=85692 RepID=UPI0018917EAA|nr:uncharacterized protein LOC119328461 [Triticum dicoccoides]
MKFLMQPVSSKTLIEEVNDSEIPMEPLHYPVLPTPAAGLPAASASSADAIMCSATVVATGEEADQPQASEHSIEQIDPQAPGWTRRVRIGAAAPGRVPNPDRMTVFEKSVRVFAEAPGENVIVLKIGISFDTLGGAYDFYNLYSWEKGFGIRYGKSRLNVNRTKCMQEIVCGCAGKPIVENTRSCRCECPALVRLLRSKDNG